MKSKIQKSLNCKKIEQNIFFLHAINLARLDHENIE